MLAAPLAGDAIVLHLPRDARAIGGASNGKWAKNIRGSLSTRPGRLSPSDSVRTGRVSSSERRSSLMGHRLADRLFASRTWYPSHKRTPLSLSLSQHQAPRCGGGKACDRSFGSGNTTQSHTRPIFLDCRLFNRRVPAQPRVTWWRQANAHRIGYTNKMYMRENSIKPWT